MKNRNQEIKPHKCVYVKGGDVVAEVKRCQSENLSIHTIFQSSPDVFYLSIKEKFLGSQLQIINLGDTDGNVTVENIEASTYNIRKTSTPGKLKSLFRYITKVLKFRPSTMFYGADGTISLLSLLTAKICRAQFIFCVNSDLVSNRSSKQIKVHKILCKQADAILTHGPFLQKQVADLGADEKKIYDYELGFDHPYMEKLRGSAYEPKPAKEQIELFFAGRAERQKGIFELLEAFEKIDATTPITMTLALVNGTDAEEFENAVQESPSSDRISLLHNVEYSEVLDIFKRADIVVCPTRSELSEGRCMSVLEALYFGTPVIAPNIGAFPYAIENEKNGLLYTSDSSSELESKIRLLVEDPALRSELSENAWNGLSDIKNSRTFTQAIDDVVTEKVTID